MSQATSHGLPQLSIGLTEWRQVINDGFLLLNAGLFKSGDYEDRPSLSGETDPGQWYYAADVRALFYDDGTTWRLVSSAAKRTVSTAGAAELLTDYDATIEASPGAGALDIELGSGASHQGLDVMVRRVSAGSNALIVSGPFADASGSLALPREDDFVVVRSDGSAWHLVSDGRQATSDELWTGRWFNDGSTVKRVYRRTLTVATTRMPNNSLNSTLSHGITGLSRVLSASGNVSDGANFLPLPFVGYDLLPAIRVDLTSTVVRFGSTGNYSSFSGFLAVEYTTT